jgi:prephenate dehydrogenase
MGGSLALALNGHCREIIGVDQDVAVISLALEKNIIHSGGTDPAVLIHKADIVILATPICSILRLLDQLPSWHPGNAVIIDLGSTKAEIMSRMSMLPDRLQPVGGHPLCGKEKSSLQHADANLFVGTPFLLTSQESTTTHAREIAEGLAMTIGAIPIWVDIQQHDATLALTSHLPYLIANALAAIIPEDSRKFMGPGLRSTTRLAGSSLSMMMDIIRTNRQNILTGIHQYRERLGEMESYLEAGDYEQLEKLLQAGHDRYSNSID